MLTRMTLIFPGASTAVPLKKYIDEAKALKAQTVPYLHRKARPLLITGLP